MRQRRNHSNGGEYKVLGAFHSKPQAPVQRCSHPLYSAYAGQSIAVRTTSDATMLGIKECKRGLIRMNNFMGIAHPKLKFCPFIFKDGENSTQWWPTEDKNSMHPYCSSVSLKKHHVYTRLFRQNTVASLPGAS